ncbi:SIMPL domain-containing protein [Methyloceanibacter sp.]|uniref:SIMPL domain-containing protein n=1 Tax=Methyloceanibacter sp. TaxID=1965321 RepID=UPI003D6CEDCD
MTLKRQTAFLALLIFTALPVNMASADEAPKRTISLAATGAIRTTPDKVDISTGVTAQAPTAKEALAKNSEAMTQVVAALKAEGLDPKDIQTTNFTVQPLYEERKDGRSPNIVGYQVTNSVQVTVRDVGKLGQILDKVVTLGANDVNSIEFGVAEPEALKDEARKLAMRNAIANAKLYAEAAGAKLGKVLTISEDQGIVFARSVAPAPMEMAAKAVPIEAGTTTVEARVSVTFELD